MSNSRLVSVMAGALLSTASVIVLSIPAGATQGTVVQTNPENRLTKCTRILADLDDLEKQVDSDRKLTKQEILEGLKLAKEAGKTYNECMGLVKKETMDVIAMKGEAKKRFEQAMTEFNAFRSTISKLQIEGQKTTNQIIDAMNKMIDQMDPGFVKQFLTKHKDVYAATIKKGINIQKKTEEDVKDLQTGLSSSLEEFNK